MFRQEIEVALILPVRDVNATYSSLLLFLYHQKQAGNN